MNHHQKVLYSAVDQFRLCMMMMMKNMMISLQILVPYIITINKFMKCFFQRLLSVPYNVDLSKCYVMLNVVQVYHVKIHTKFGRIAFWYHYIPFLNIISNEYKSYNYWHSPLLVFRNITIRYNDAILNHVFIYVIILRIMVEINQ